MLDASDFAFARPMFHNTTSGAESEPQRGLTKREMFAMAAMQGLLAARYQNASRDYIAVEAVLAADALLGALEANHG